MSGTAISGGGLGTVPVTRATAFDPFGRDEVRRVERDLPGEYVELVGSALGALSPSTLETVVAIAELLELVRGYERIKLAGVERFRARAAELAAELGKRAEGARAAASLRSSTTGEKAVGEG